MMPDKCCVKDYKAQMICLGGCDLKKHTLTTIKRHPFSTAHVIIQRYLHRRVRDSVRDLQVMKMRVVQHREQQQECKPNLGIIPRIIWFKQRDNVYIKKVAESQALLCFH